MTVVDASVAVKWFGPEKGNAPANGLLQTGQTLVALDFVIFDTLNVLRREYKQGVVRIAQYETAARDLVLYFDKLVPAAQIVVSAVELATKLDHGVYDCAYLACAIQEKTQVITADDVLVRKAAANGLQAHVTLL